MCQKALLSNNDIFNYFLNDWVLNEVINRRSWMSIFPEIEKLRKELRDQNRRDKNNIKYYESKKKYPFKYLDIPSVSGKSKLKFVPYYEIDYSMKIPGERLTLGEKIIGEISRLKGNEFLKKLVVLRYIDGLLKLIEGTLDSLYSFEEEVSEEGVFREIDRDRLVKILNSMGFQNNPLGVLLECIILKAGKA